MGAEFEGLPRMRGDPPGADPVRDGWESSTPHARGSTVHSGILAAGLHVYPACAGIHLMLCLLGAVMVSLPRMRGDPPIDHTEWIEEE